MAERAVPTRMLPMKTILQLKTDLSQKSFTKKRDILKLLKVRG